MATPDWQCWLDSQWGPSYDGPSICGLIAAASNVIIGTNPPYTIQDFFAIYPKFGGPQLTLTGVVTAADSPNVTVTSTTGVKAGNPVAPIPGVIQDGTFVQSVPDSTHLVLTQDAISNGTAVLNVWNNTPIPLAVIGAYLALANNCLVQARWQDMWQIAMALFVAHFLSLYARSDGNPYSNIGQIAAQGLSLGIQISKNVGDVGVSYQPVTGLEDWGAWTLTLYGTQLAQFAKVIGSGPMLLY